MASFVNMSENITLNESGMAGSVSCQLGIV